jgi:hypothetical protein
VKKTAVILSLFFCFTGMMIYAQTAVSLDQAIKTAAQQFSQKLEKGSTVAVLYFGSESQQFSAYVMDELTNEIVNVGTLTAVDRRRLDLIRSEIEFNESGDISDQSQQQAGRMLGAQSIITGTLEDIGSVYRFRVQSLTVESAKVQASASLNLNKKDPVVQNFMKEASGIQDYTKNERAIMAGLNVLFGTGSWMKRDTFGGGITAGAEGLGLVLLLYGAIDSASYTEDSTSSVPDFDYFAMYGGAGILAGGAIFGIIRGFTYHKPGANLALADLNNWNLAILPDKNGLGAVRMSYTLHF